jgi:subtilisin family serine protease
MHRNAVTLRRDPQGAKTYTLVESPNRFVVHFKTSLPGGSAAKAALRLPMMFGRRVHARKLPLPPKLAIFEVRPDEAAQRLPVYGEDAQALRDAAMSYVRSTIGRDWSQVRACYHTYTRVVDHGRLGNRDNEVFPAGKLFLEFNAAVPADEQYRILDYYKLVVDRTILYWPGAFVVSVSQETGASPVRLAAELQGLTFRVRGIKEPLPLFDYADPILHRRREYQTVPSDGLFPLQWYLRNDGSEGGVVGADIAVTEAWDYTRGEPEVLIAVIDDGFVLEHPDIGAEGRIAAPLDVMAGTPDPRPTAGADEWHGTSVLGLICAAHNGRGACGVAPQCRFIPIKMEALADDEAEARAFDHAVASGAAVINCSWGPYDDYSREPWPIPRIVSLAIDHAYRNDVCVVFAAGNGNEEIATDGYASHPRVIAVAASTDQNKRAYYSDFGEAVWVCAPSSGGRRGVVTTDVDEGGYNPLGSYSSGFGGTSSAAPLVSGVIALMQSAYARKYGPGHRLSVDQVKAILRDTAEKIDPDGPPFFEYWERRPIKVTYDSNGHSLAYGYGLVHAARAVRKALEMPPRQVSPTPVGQRERSGAFVSGSPKLPARRVGDPLALFGSDRTMSEESRQRFESGEHVWIGDRGFELGIVDAQQLARMDAQQPRMLHRQDKREAFRYGELVALSGDFYGTPDELYWETPTCLPWLWEQNDLSDIRAAFARELDAIKEQQRRGRVEYPDNNLIYYWNAKAYAELALANTSHFGWHNMKAYCKHHHAALEFARQAHELRHIEPSKAEELWGLALFTNAFADHFLTDAFAAGHIRVPRHEILVWSAQLGFSEKLAGALTKLLHDQDGHLDTLHGDGHSLLGPSDQGLAVCNARGEAWRTRCDGQLFIGNDGAELAIHAPVQAVRASVKELLLVYLCGEEALPSGVYEGTTYVPFPDPRGPSLCDKFPAGIGADQLDRLLQSTQWYMKIPYIGPGLAAEHIQALCAALPELLAAFRQSVQRDVTEQPELTRRLPPQLIAAFQAIA